MTIVFDCDGVLYLGAEGVPGAGETLDTLAADGRHLLFVTNNATKSAQDVAAAIHRTTGHEASAEQVVTSAMVTAEALGGTVGAVYAIGESGLREALRTAGIAVHTGDTDGLPAAVDAVVVGLDRSLTYGMLSRATRYVRSGARFVATNADPTYPTPQGLVPGGGAIVAALEAATGTEPEVMGKPHMPMVKAVAARVGPGPVWVVGDRVDTDMVLAAAGGWGKVLVLTGATRPDESVDPALVDVVLESVANLPAYLR